MNKDEIDELMTKIAELVGDGKTKKEWHASKYTSLQSRNVSFAKGYLDLLEYVEQLADDKHGGVFAAAIMQIIREHRDVQEEPAWLPGLVDKLRGDDGLT